MLHILQAYARNGPPSRKVRDWNGRWWSLWGAVDLLPMGNKVMTASPGFLNPLMDAGEIEVTGRDTGRIALANGYGSHGEPVRRERSKSGKVTAVWLSAGKMMPADKVAREMEANYAKPASRRRGRERKRREASLFFSIGHDLVRKSVPTPDQVRGRLFRDHALAPRRSTIEGLAHPGQFARGVVHPRRERIAQAACRRRIGFQHLQEHRRVMRITSRARARSRWSGAASR